ncbi:MAG: hypothetical protein MHM6MM_006620 [Cercozoa sp. M6MM]
MRGGQGGLPSRHPSTQYYEQMQRQYYQQQAYNQQMLYQQHQQQSHQHQQHQQQLRQQHQQQPQHHHQEQQLQQQQHEHYGRRYVTRPWQPAALPRLAPSSVPAYVQRASPQSHPVQHALRAPVMAARPHTHFVPHATHHARRTMDKSEYAPKPRARRRLTCPLCETRVLENKIIAHVLKCGTKYPNRHGVPLHAWQCRLCQLTFVTETESIDHVIKECRRRRVLYPSHTKIVLARQYVETRLAYNDVKKIRRLVLQRNARGLRKYLKTLWIQCQPVTVPDPVLSDPVVAISDDNNSNDDDDKNSENNNSDGNNNHNNSDGNNNNNSDGNNSHNNSGNNSDNDDSESESESESYDISLEDKKDETSTVSSIVDTCETSVRSTADGVIDSAFPSISQIFEQEIRRLNVRHLPQDEASDEESLDLKPVGAREDMQGKTRLLRRFVISPSTLPGGSRRVSYALRRAHAAFREALESTKEYADKDDF